MDPYPALQPALMLLVESTRVLRPPAPDAPLAADLGRLTRMADELAARAAEAHARGDFAAGPADRPADHAAVLRHDLKNAAGRVVTLCDLLIEDEADAVPVDLAADLRAVRAAARKAIGFIDEIGRESSTRPGPAPLPVDRPPADLARSIETPGRVLFADDDSDNRELVGRLLGRRGGHQVTTVADGRKALDALAAGPFDVVLLDVRMPGLSGFDVLGRIREHPDWRHVPVVMISALGEEEDVLAGLALGADDYVRRPFNPRLLLARVASCLDRKRLRDREVDYRRQIDRLFRALFPADVADELRQHGTFPPRLAPRVGVLFLDVVGFTQFCEAHKNDLVRVVDNLQGLVARLEAVAGRHGVQKIKTIGDAFLAAAGLTRPDPDPVGTLVRCGRDMLAALADHPAGWQARVGVHVGPVMAGVIGDTQFQYDVWGDTVNHAARLQAAGRPGEMTLSDPAWAALADPPPGTRREVALAGIGTVAVWDTTG